MTLGQQRHMSGMSAAQSHIQQCPLNCVFRNTCSWTCIVLGCQLSHCLAPDFSFYSSGSAPDVLLLMTVRRPVIGVYPLSCNILRQIEQPTSGKFRYTRPSLGPLTICFYQIR
ncbi:hypothetical protein AVEN_107755-1 [Araneus ventricosus]|uniref:Uncharacterized protein n=1 Tax=Araneus ventricosus TaxID=182803 RepID=A0A4Y2JQE3_ARAVE|nr:hypothetical protein AVEN_107755-1 [Araneus ventricosus]